MNGACSCPDDGAVDVAKGDRIRGAPETDATVAMANGAYRPTADEGGPRFRMRSAAPADQDEQKRALLIPERRQPLIVGYGQ